MTVVQVTVEIDAPPQAVWDVVFDPRNLPNWDQHIEAVEGVPDGDATEGTTYTTVLRFMGVHARVEAEVLECDPPARGRVRLSGLVDATVETSIQSLPAGRSLLRHRVDYRFRGGVLGRLAARSLRLLGGAQYALRHGALEQKRDVESRR